MCQQHQHWEADCYSLVRSCLHENLKDRERLRWVKNCFHLICFLFVCFSCVKIRLYWQRNKQPPKSKRLFLVFRWTLFHTRAAVRLNTCPWRSCIWCLGSPSVTLRAHSLPVMHLCLLQVDSGFAGTAVLSSSPCIQIDAKAEVLWSLDFFRNLLLVNGLTNFNNLISTPSRPPHSMKLCWLISLLNQIVVTF